jgi:hypothetical protein
MKNILLPLALVKAFVRNAQVTVDWNQFVQGLSIALDQENTVFTVNYDANLGGDITLIKRDSEGQQRSGRPPTTRPAPRSSTRPPGWPPTRWVTPSSPAP